MIQVEAVRIATSAYPSRRIATFPIRSRARSMRSAQAFREGRGHFESQHALILTYRPPEKPARARALYLFRQREPDATYADTVLESFRPPYARSSNISATHSPSERMVTQEVRRARRIPQRRYDELFQFIRFCITGENHPVRLNEIPMYLDWLATAELHHGVSPKVENRYLAVVRSTVSGRELARHPQRLDLMPLTYRWSPLHLPGRPGSRQKLERTRKKWQQKVRPFFDQLFQTQSRSVDQDAMLMVAETEDAIAQASSQLVSYGYYTPVIVLFDETSQVFAEKAEAVRRLIQAEGFGARIETINATEAFLGSLPATGTPTSANR
jgi:type IV secretion system protein VirB4